MSSDDNSGEDLKPPKDSAVGKISRGALQVAAGAMPFVGGAFSALASAWSDAEQAKANRFFEHWIQIIKDELKEKEQTIIEIMARLDLADENITRRIESPEFQSLIRKTFREWSGAESEEKRIHIRNILANAASASLASDDVIRMFISWINLYSEMHFQVIGAMFNSDGIARREIWRKIGKGQVREDSADADLFKLLFRDLSTGGVIRQHREVDYYGNFVPKNTKRRPRGSGPKPPVSAFDEEEGYELTELGKQFVHYAMTDLPLRIEFSDEVEEY